LAIPWPKGELQKAMEAAISTLDPQEQNVLRWRYGLGQPQQTLQQICEYYLVTRERIKAIEQQGLRKLRQLRRIKPILDLIKTYRDVLKQIQNLKDQLEQHRQARRSWQKQVAESRVVIIKPNKHLVLIKAAVLVASLSDPTSLELPTATMLRLRRAGINNLGDLIQAAEESVAAIQDLDNFASIKARLEEQALAFNCQVVNWDLVAAQLAGAEVDYSLLNMPVDHLNISAETARCLQIAQIQYLGDLVKWTEAELLDSLIFPRESVIEIKQKLAAVNLALGMLAADRF
jgi:DNA-directed RNA polymerase alpha subunit